MIRYIQVVNEATHISGSQIDHVYIKNTLLGEVHTKTILQTTFLICFKSPVLKHLLISFSHLVITITWKNFPNKQELS